MDRITPNSYLIQVLLDILYTQESEFEYDVKLVKLEYKQIRSSRYRIF